MASFLRTPIYAMVKSESAAATPDLSMTDSDGDTSTSTSSPDDERFMLGNLDRLRDPSTQWHLAKAAWLAEGSGWDLSGKKDLSRLLKEATAQAHVDVLRPAVVNKLITGQIPLQVHVRYLMMLHCVYETMEAGLAQHAHHPCLAPSHNAHILDRTQAITEDISYFLKLAPGVDWQSHPLAQPVLRRPPAALTAYLDRLRSLADDNHSQPRHWQRDGTLVYPPAPASVPLLLAHAYVRYMGDLNGGQMIKNSVATAYDIDKEQTDGLRFYRFDIGSTSDATDFEGAASPAQISKLASTFRRGIDAAGQLMSAADRAAMLQEANHAFELNIALFSSFDDDDNDDSAMEPTSSKKVVLERLQPPPGVGIPAIPSPSLEGYAKAATYMPKSRNLTADSSTRLVSKSVNGIPAPLLAVAVAVPFCLLLWSLSR